MGLIEKLNINVYRNLDGVWPSTIHCQFNPINQFQVLLTVSEASLWYWPI